MPLSSRYVFEDFVDQASKATSLDELFSLFLIVLASYGFDRVNFSIMRDLEIPEKYWAFGLLNTYTCDWMNHYAERRFALYDPVLLRAGLSRRPFWWRDLGQEAPLTRHQRAIMGEAAEAGLHNGFGVPLSGPGQQLAGVAMATSIKTAAPYRKAAVLAAVCTHFYDRVKILIGTELPMTLSQSTFSARELETLSWLSHGHTDEEIAGRMGISEHTVNGYLRRIFIELGVHNRNAAVQEARKRGIIPAW